MLVISIIAIAAIILMLDGSRCDGYLQYATNEVMAKAIILVSLAFIAGVPVGMFIEWLLEGA